MRNVLSSSVIRGLDSTQIEQSSGIDNVEVELKLVKRLIRLSKVCWSPTLQANAEVIESLGRELQAVSASRRKAKWAR